MITAGQHAPVITIDGPSGSGKGTIALSLARRLGWHFLDSGALYRIVALIVVEQHIDLDDTERLVHICETLEVVFEADVDRQVRVLLEGLNISQAIRREEVGNVASKVAAIPAIREALVERQIAFRQMPGLVADGRDMGTIIFPTAELKIFLTASTQIRAQRRYKQLKEKGENVNLARLFREIEARDERDRNRAVAPLRPADDAIILDSSSLSVEAVLGEIMKVVEGRGLSL